jgi:hypothetical protein
MVRSALHNAEETWFDTIAARCGPAASARILALIGEDATPATEGAEEDEEDEDPGSVLALINSVPTTPAANDCARESRPREGC